LYFQVAVVLSISIGVVGKAFLEFDIIGGEPRNRISSELGVSNKERKKSKIKVQISFICVLRPAARIERALSGLDLKESD